MKRKTAYESYEAMDESDVIDSDAISSHIIEVNPPHLTVMLYYGGGGDFKIISRRSGKIYYFKAGFPTEVDITDAEEFLKMTKMAGCCGHKYSVHLFEKA